MYEKTIWNNGTAPGISAERLNKIEQGIYEPNLINDKTLTNGVLSGLKVEFGTASVATVYDGTVYFDGKTMDIDMTGVNLDIGGTGTINSGFISVNQFGEVVFDEQEQFSNILLAEIDASELPYKVIDKKQTVTSSTAFYELTHFLDGTKIEFSNGYTILNINKNLGDITAQGDGTYSNPFRTISNNVDLNSYDVTFYDDTNVQITPKITGVDVPSRNMSASFDKLSNNIIKDVRIFRNSTESTAAEVFASIRVEGMSNRVQISLG